MNSYFILNYLNLGILTFISEFSLFSWSPDWNLKILPVFSGFSLKSQTLHLNLGTLIYSHLKVVILTLVLTATLEQPASAAVMSRAEGELRLQWNYHRKSKERGLHGLCCVFSLSGLFCFLKLSVSGRTLSLSPRPYFSGSLESCPPPPSHAVSLLSDGHLLALQPFPFHFSCCSFHHPHTPNEAGL